MASSVSFHDLCQLLEKISNVPKKRRSTVLQECRSTILQEFLDQQRPRILASTDVEEKTGGLFPIARLLMPALDRDRGNYGIKENKLAQRYIRVLGLARQGDDARRLLNYRAPAMNHDLAGDFAAVVCHVIQDLVRTKPSELTVGDVNKHLDALAIHHAANNTAGEDRILQILLQSTSVLEQKWLIRIILKNVKFGLGRTRIFRAIHPDAEKLFDVCSSIKNVCLKLPDPARRLNEVGVTLGTPFSPMLADRVDIGLLEKHVLQHPRLLCETKLDGERVQIHKNGQGYFKYFSRRSFDYSEKFGSTEAVGTLTYRLLNQLTSVAKTFIIDGEMMVWDSNTKIFKQKGQNVDVKFLKRGDAIVPCFCAFDILYLNGEVLTNKPLETRLQILSTIFKEEEGVIMHAKRWPVSTKEEIYKSLNEAIDAQDEGIMLKDPLSVYKPSERKSGWWKVKPEYNDALMEHVDVVVVGGYWGAGARSGIVSQFLLAVALTPSAPGGNPTEFHTLGRVGSGYTREELGVVMNKLQRNWQPTQPDNVKCVGTEKPDVWVDPTKSIILEVKASEIVPSGAYFTKCTLRFPRTEKPRYDLSYKDCLTTARLTDIRKLAAGKLATQRVTTATVASKRKRPAPRPIVESLASQFQPADLSGLTQESTLLRGKEFCVFSGTKDGEYSKQDIEKIIHKHGGTIIQNPGSKTWAVLAHSREQLRVTNLVKSGGGHPKCDVVRVSWLLSVVSEGLRLPEPRDLLASSEATEDRLRKSHDCCGDAFTQPATIESINYIIDNWPEDVKWVESFFTIEEEIYDLETQLLEGSNLKSIFRPFYAYFDQFETLKESTNRSASYWPLEVAKKEFQFYGGHVSEDFSPKKINLVVVDPSSSGTRVAQLLSKRRADRMFHIVRTEWIEQSVRAGRALPEGQFSPVKQ